MAHAHAEIHVADVGTRYLLRVWDDEVPFDPSDAAIQRILFHLPGGQVLAKDADAVIPEGSPPTAWMLEYRVRPNDGLGSPPGDFHAATGPIRIQAYLAWTDQSQFHSNIRTADERGRELRIYRNLQ